VEIEVWVVHEKQRVWRNDVGEIDGMNPQVHGRRRPLERVQQCKGQREERCFGFQGTSLHQRILKSESEGL
jgi:hypothetical protein